MFEEFVINPHVKCCYQDTWGQFVVKIQCWMFELLARYMKRVCCQDAWWQFVVKIHVECLLMRYIKRVCCQHYDVEYLLAGYMKRVCCQVTCFIVKIQCWIFVTVCCQDTMLNLYWQDTWREFVVKLHVFLSRYSVEWLLPRYMKTVCCQDTWGKFVVKIHVECLLARYRRLSLSPSPGDQTKYFEISVV